MTQRADTTTRIPGDGAMPTLEPSLPRRAASPTRGDRVARAASHVIGGPQGRFAAVGARGWRPAAAILSALSSVFVALGVVQKNHCVSTGWATPGSLWRACYSDLPVAVAGQAGSSPWSNPLTQNQPPLTALVTWLVRLIVPSGSQLRLQQGMFAWGAALVALLIALAVCATASALPRGPWAAAHVALSPVLITSALISFDALGVALVAGGLLAWYRSKPAVAGIALMAAMLTRPMLGAVLAAALIVALSRGLAQAAGRVLLGSGATLLAVVGLVTVCGGDPFASWNAWRVQGAGFGSLWYLLTFSGITISAGTLTALVILGWGLAIALAVLLTQRHPHIDVAPVAMLVLLVVMLTSRALPVQACLWVLPLIALSCVKWRDHLVWAAAEFVYYITVWGFIARGSNMAKALPEGWYAFFCLVRFAGLAWLTYACVASAPRERVQVAARAKAGSHRPADETATA